MNKTLATLLILAMASQPALVSAGNPEVKRQCRAADNAAQVGSGFGALIGAETGAATAVLFGVGCALSSLVTFGVGGVLCATAITAGGIGGAVVGSKIGEAAGQATCD